MNKTLSTLDLDYVSDACYSEFDSLKNAHLFMTGGTGFFGKWLLETLLYANKKYSHKTQVTVLTRNPKNFIKNAPHLALHPQVTLHDGNIQNFSYPHQTFTHLIHLAAPTLETAQVDAKGMLPLFQEFYQGTLHVLEFAKQAGVQRFLEISSGSIYGKQPENLEKISEAYSGAPDLQDFRSGLGEGKRISEYLSLTYGQAFSFDVVVARCFAFAGPYLPAQGYEFGNFIQNAIDQEPILIQGDGKTIRSYLYAADLAIWLWKLSIQGRSGQTYNVGSEQAFTLLEVAQMISQAVRPELSIQLKNQRPSGSRNTYIPDTSKIRKECMIPNEIALREAIQRTLSYYSTPTLR